MWHLYALPQAFSGAFVRHALARTRFMRSAYLRHRRHHLWWADVGCFVPQMATRALPAGRYFYQRKHNHVHPDGISMRLSYECGVNYYLIDSQHCAVDISIVGVGGITRGLDATTLAKRFTTLSSPSQFGAAWQFIYVNQALIADGFMVSFTRIGNLLYH